MLFAGQATYAQTQEDWEDSIEGKGPWIAIVGTKSKFERLGGGEAYLGFAVTGISGTKSFTDAQGIQQAPDFTNFTVTGLNAHPIEEGLEVIFTEQVTDKKQEITYYLCKDMNVVDEVKPGYDNNAVYSTKLLLNKSGEVILRERNSSGDIAAPSLVRWFGSGDQTREEFIAGIRNYIDENTKSSESITETNFDCDDLPDAVSRNSQETEVIQIFSYEQGRCTTEPPTCNSEGDPAVRFVFGASSFGCYNPEAPIIAASYITYADGSSYELNLWDRNGTNQGSFCGQGIPEVEVAEPNPNPSGGTTIYRPIPVIATPNNGNPPPDDDPSGSPSFCPSSITLTPNLEVWNADEAFNFKEQIILKDEKGMVINSEDVYWYVQSRFHDKDGNGEYEMREIEDDEAYYFGSEINADEWGPVKIFAIYYCNGQPYSNVTTIEVVDAGIYFRNANGDILRWHEAIYEKDPSRYEGFYDPSKKTMLFSHGWQPGGTMDHSWAPTQNPSRDRQTKAGIDAWYSEGWNVLLFYWTQYASTQTDLLNSDLIDPNLLKNNADQVDVSPFFASVHATKPNPRWFRTYPDVEPTTEAATTDPIGVLAGKRFKEIRDKMGGDAGKELRFVGHSFGHIIITRASEWLLANSPYKVDRMAWLDPAMDVEALLMHERFTVVHPEAPIVEWYQTSVFDLGFQFIANQLYDDRVISSPTLAAGLARLSLEFFSGIADGITSTFETVLGIPLSYADIYTYGFVTNNAEVSFYNELIVNTTYVRLHPLWQDGEGFFEKYPFGAELLHGSAIPWYLSSISDPSQPTYIERCPAAILPCVEGALRYDRALDNAYAPGLPSLPFITSGLNIYLYNPEVTFPNGPSAAASSIELGVWKGVPLEQVKGVSTFSRADDYFTARVQLDYDPIPSPDNLRSSEDLSNTLEESALEDKASSEYERTFPNPFTNEFTLDYTLEEAGTVSVQVYNMSGRLVASPSTDVQQPQGAHHLPIDGSTWNQGLYIVLLIKPDGTVVNHRVSKE